MKRYNFFILLLVYISLLIFLAGCSGNGYIPVPPQGQITPGGMAYTWYDWPQLPASGFYNFDVLLTIDVDPGVQSAYYWAHQFGFKNGDGGYVGLQTNGYMQGEWVGKIAIFSIWEALEAEPGPGASCESFTGEGKGWSCRIKYNWEEGHTYCLRIWEICCAEQPWEDEWWGAWITDTFSNQETYIGKIKVPGSWKWLDNSSVVWVEYYGQVNDCTSIPYAKARFEQPTADNGDFMPQKLTSVIGTTCTNAQITLLGNQGVSFEIGGSTANYAPVISNLTANPSSIDINQTTTITCTASDPDGDSLTYNWTKTGGTFEGSTSGSSITWRAPSTEGNYTIECEVSDGEASDSKSVNISVGGSTGSTVSSIEVFPETMNIGVGNSQSIELITAHYDNGSTADIALNACTYISSNTGVATVDIGVITAIALGSATITVEYTEGDITKIDTVAVTVSADVNHTPVITSTAVTSATVNQLCSYNVNATDSDGDTLVYSLTTKPSGMSINSSTGLIAWTPTTSGDYNVTVKVSDGELFDTQSFTVIVEESGTTTRIIRLVGDLSFGSVNVGSTSQKALTIYNDGNSTLTVSSISYPTGFSGNWSGTISAGGSRNVTVTFAPTQAITYSGTLTVNSDKTSGTNTKSVLGTGTQITTTRIIRLVGDLSFGSVNVGSTSQKALTIYNDGNSTLTVSSISYPTGFSGNWSGTISAGGSRNVTVTFAPTQAITYSGTLTVNSDKTSGTNTKSVSGTGTSAITLTLDAACQTLYQCNGCWQWTGGYFAGYNVIDFDNYSYVTIWPTNNGGILPANIKIKLEGIKWNNGTWNSFSEIITQSDNYRNGYRLYISNNKIYLKLQNNFSDAFNATPWKNVKLTIIDQTGNNIGSYSFKTGIFPRVRSNFGQCVWWAIKRKWETDWRYTNTMISAPFYNPVPRGYKIECGPSEYLPTQYDILVDDSYTRSHYAFIESVKDKIRPSDGRVYKEVLISQYNYPSQEKYSVKTLYWWMGRDSVLWTTDITGYNVDYYFQFNYYIRW